MQSIGQLVRRLRGLWTYFSYFLHEGELGSGSRFSQWKSGFHEPLVSGSHSCSCVSYGGLWKNFFFLYVKVDMFSEVDSRPAGEVRTRKSGHYLYELPVDV